MAHLTVYLRYFVSVSAKSLTYVDLLTLIKSLFYDSCSYRQFKGIHRVLNRFNSFMIQVSKRDRRTCWILKCDVRKFFASIDHEKLIQIFKRHIQDADTVWLIERVVASKVVMLNNTAFSAIVRKPCAYTIV